MTPPNATTAGTARNHSSEPSQLPLRIAGPTGDTRAVESAFLSILARRHPDTHWEITDRRVTS